MATKTSSSALRKGAPEGLSLVYLNGDIVPRDKAVVSAFDSGLNFADGVFEGIRVYDGRVFRLDEHLRRLFESAKSLSIDIGLTIDEMRNVVLEWLRANQVAGDFHFRPIVTRGLRYPPRLDPRYCTGPATVLIVGGEISESSPPIAAVIASVRRTSPDALDPKIKSLNYGNALLARLEAIRQGMDDALMLDGAGYLAEATTSNVFVAKDGELFTPHPKACLEGITRAAVIELARKDGLAVTERDISPSELINAHEIFLAGTAAQITPVVKLNGQPIGTGTVGPISAGISAAYERLVRSNGAPIWN